MTHPERSTTPFWLEHRGKDRPYDEQDVSTLLVANGTAVASSDRAFLAAATAYVLAGHGWAP